MNRPLPKSDVTSTDEETVAHFLSQHPDFFERHPALLAQLKVPHARGDSSTVSLVERQVDILRERSKDIELRLTTLLDNGRTNDGLATKIHGLAKRLIKAQSAQARLSVIEAALREDFAAHEFVIVLTAPSKELKALKERYLKILDAADPALQSFDTLFTAGKPRCGRIRDSQREFLFPNDATSVGSVALVPMGTRTKPALLAIASVNADHFNPAMSTDFLSRIGDLIATAIDATPGESG